MGRLIHCGMINFQSSRFSCTNQPIMSATKKFSEKQGKEYVSFCNLFTFTSTTDSIWFIV